MVRASERAKVESTGRLHRSVLLLPAQEDKCSGNLLLPGVPHHPTAKAPFPYRLRQMLYTTDHTPSCLAGKKTTKQCHSTAVTLMSLRGHLGEGGGVGEEGS